MERKHYQTPGRVALSDFLELHPDRQYTADELYAAVSERVRVGRSTVYRLLAELCRDEVVRKFRSEARQSNVYQYIGTSCDCRDHFHEKCVKCGAVYHLDCHATSEFIHHLFAEHGFWVDCGQTILYGVCAICRGEV